MARNAPRDPYRRLVEEVRRTIRAHVPAGSVVLVASKGDDELIELEGYRGWHFPRDEWGSYAGHHPGSSAEALAHLRHLYAQGARYLVFPQTSAWWLEHYGELAAHLEEAHEALVSEPGVCVVYALHESEAFDAFLSLEDGGRASSDDAAVDESDILTLVQPLARAPLRVLTVLARYGTEQYPDAEQRMEELLARQLPGVQRKMLVVDNALDRHVVQPRLESGVVIGGDNRAGEFSAFDRAVQFLGSDLWSYDLVHFATSAFNTLYVAYLDRLEPDLLEAVAVRPACLGHIDCYNDPIEVRTCRAQHWIRSCCFFLPPTEVKALGSFVSVRDTEPLFSGDPANPFHPDAPLSQRYRDYITQWLTGEGLGQGVRWHSTFALTEESLRRFEEKARAILNEQLLSIRLQALGCSLVDVTWLSTTMRRAEEIAWTTPWREQLAQRDRDALRLPDMVHAPARVTV